MSSDDPIVQCSICGEKVPRGYILCPFCGADLTVSYKTQVFAPVNWKETFRRIKLMIIRPREIFTEIAENPDTRGGFLFIVIISLMLAAQIMAYLIHARVLIWKTSPLVFILLWIFILILPTVIWFLGSWIIRIFTRLLGGKVTGKQVRAAFGYGMLPVVFAETLNMILYFIALPWRSPDTTSFSEIFQAFNELRNSFAGITGMVLHFAGFLAAGVYMVFILKPATELTWWETGIATSIPVLIFTILLITYYLVG